MGRQAIQADAAGPRVDGVAVEVAAPGRAAHPRVVGHVPIAAVDVHGAADPVPQGLDALDGVGLEEPVAALCGAHQLAEGEVGRQRLGVVELAEVQEAQGLAVQRAAFEGLRVVVIGSPRGAPLHQLEAGRPAVVGAGVADLVPLVGVLDRGVARVGGVVTVSGVGSMVVLELPLGARHELGVEVLGGAGEHQEHAALYPASTTSGTKSTTSSPRSVSPTRMWSPKGQRPHAPWMTGLSSGVGLIPCQVSR